MSKTILPMRNIVSLVSRIISLTNNIGLQTSETIPQVSKTILLTSLAILLISKAAPQPCELALQCFATAFTAWKSFQFNVPAGNIVADASG
jgi:hypothetical protein